MGAGMNYPYRECQSGIDLQGIIALFQVTGYKFTDASEPLEILNKQRPAHAGKMTAARKKGLIA